MVAPEMGGLTVGPDPDREPPITPTDLAGMINDAGSTALSQQVVDAAIGYVEDRCGPIGPCQWTYRVRQARDGTLNPPSGGLASVDALIGPDGTDHTASVVADDVDWSAGQIHAPVTADGTWLVQVTTARGDAAVAALKEAATIIARHLWTVRRGPLDSPSSAQGLYGANPQAPVTGIGVGYAIPSRAMQLMADHLVGGFA